MNQLNAIQIDRAVGSVLASAVGDALGSAFEFKPPREDDWKPYFSTGFFGHAPGEWTDDTSMAIPILEWVASRGELPKRYILERWIEWSADSKDVGILTRSILEKLDPKDSELETLALFEAQQVHKESGKSAGNGSLMRIGPYALKNLHKPLDLKELSELTRWTHWDEDNIIACQFWIESIRLAIAGEFSIRNAIHRCNLQDNMQWITYIEKATASGVRARDFNENNGWVVAALQGALASIITTDNLVDALEESIRGGGDTDTVAAITGSLAGAIYGAKAIPNEWRSAIHGWPGYTADILELLVLQSVHQA